MDGTRQTGIAAEGDERLWVSSTGGATAFAPGDSTYLRLFRNDGLPSQDLTSVVIDANGNRWFGSRGHGLQVQTPAGDFLLRPLDRFDLGSDALRVLVEAAAAGRGAWGDSTVWAGTEIGAALVEYPSDPERPDSAVLLTINIESLLGSRPLVNAIAVRDTITPRCSFTHLLRGIPLGRDLDQHLSLRERAMGRAREWTRGRAALSLLRCS
jgi:hypothetical protein